MKGPAVMARVLRAIRPYKVRPGNSIYGQSVCPDEINGDEGHFPVLMAGYFGHSFHLGGLAGVPFVGKTGFGAFSAHAPTDGDVVVVFAPHIGYTLEGDPMQFLRRGQPVASAACGAATLAYQQVRSWWPYSADRKDAQQSWLRAKLKPVSAVISRAEDPMVDLVMETYGAVEKEMLDIINTDFGTGNLVLIGGIMINMPYPMAPLFKPLHFTIRSHLGGTKDLMSAFQ
uniref:Limiting CO2-inducible protein B/C beta carbonyic anhydrase domain-containing protein n=1 Tax=Alexandrium catenella TaxID=2925 RepID=A0A7S1S7H0_ALECA